MDFLEVETPMLQSIPGGAAARPFKTHHNALDMDMFLRIAPELYLKRLTVGGLERVYEINRNFRDEGISTMHNPELTILECYTSWFDVDDVMDITQRILSRAAEVCVDGVITYKERPVSFALPFARLTMKDAIAAAARREGIALERSDLDLPARLEAFTSGEALRGRRNGKGILLTPERYASL